ncbi:MAG: metallophosphoesterase family protein [Ferrimicrobium sp.]
MDEHTSSVVTVTGVGARLNTGTKRDFRSLAHHQGEPTLVRSELHPGDRISLEGRPIARLVHLTDVQLADVKSPTRFEYINRYSHLPNVGGLIPGYRPQEFLVAAVLARFVETINKLPVSSVTGEPVSLVITTGDMIDNAQSNELNWVTTLLGGGTITLSSGIDAPEHVHSWEFGDHHYWHPDERQDDFKELFGYPIAEGVLAEAFQPLTSPGLRVPWIACNGNHEVLIQGVGKVTNAIDQLARSSMKSIDIPDNPDLTTIQSFMRSPEQFFQHAPSRTVNPDEHRATVSTEGVVDAYLNAPGQPVGHGFSPQNLRDGTAYYSYDLSDDLRIIALDTAQPAGGALGMVDVIQFDWLRSTLMEVSTFHYDRGTKVSHPGSRDAHVIIISHHPLKGLATHSDNSSTYVLPEQILELIDSFPQVILWLSGHTHQNAVVPHHSPSRPGGFWEVTTCSLMDWPSQIRLVEVIETSDHIEIACEMLTHDSPIDPAMQSGAAALASWHRLLAANTPIGGHDSTFPGLPTDRNVSLHLPRHW